MDDSRASLIDRLINQLGLISIGVFCFLSSLYTARFAEKHILIPSWNLPIFVGEMLLAWCMILLFCKWAINGFPRNRWVLGLAIYGAWIFFKAFGPGGYIGYGALSFRNAALFYYLLFGVLGYLFYDRHFFSPLVNFVLIVLLGVSLHLEMVHDYYWLAYILLFVVLAFKMPKRGLTYLILMVGLFTFSWKTLLFGSSRSHLLSVCVVFLFFFISMAFVFLPFRLRYKWLSLAGLMVVFCSGVFLFADPNAVKSVTTPSRIIKQFKELDAFVKRYENKFVLKECPVNLYNVNKPAPELVQGELSLPHWGQGEKPENKLSGVTARSLPSEEVSPQANLTSVVKEGEKNTLVHKTMTEAQGHRPMKSSESSLPAEGIPTEVPRASEIPAAQNSPETDELVLESSINLNINSIDEKQSEKELLSRPFLTEDDIQVRPELFKDVERILNETSSDGHPNNGHRSLEIAYGNIHFRLFIWRDMLAELWPNHFIAGVGFGKPQRSRSTEIIGWGKLEWRKTGWITPHNSYLHLIYRAGIVGLLIVITMFVVLIQMIRTLMQRKSLTGSLLVMCLIYWLVFAFFSVFLEVPYAAIPFWTLFGMTLAYAHRKSETIGKGVAQ